MNPANPSNPSLPPTPPPHPFDPKSSGHEPLGPRPPASDPTGGAAFSISACLDYAKDLFFRQWLFLTLFMLIYFGVSLIGNIIPFVGMLTFLALPVLLAGACGTLIEAERRGETPQFPDMFNGFKTIRGLEVVLDWILMMIVSLVTLLPLIAVGIFIVFSARRSSAGSLPLPVLGFSISLMVLGIFLTMWAQIRLSMAMIVSIEKLETEPFNPISSLRTSWEMTRGHTLQFFAIWLLVSLVSLLSVLALCVGYFLVALQLSVATLVASYLLLLPPKQRGGRFADLSTCPWCGYDLSDTAGELCPECGLEHPGRVEQTPQPIEPEL